MGLRRTLAGSVACGAIVSQAFHVAPRPYLGGRSAAAAHLAADVRWSRCRTAGEVPRALASWDWRPGAAAGASFLKDGGRDVRKIGAASSRVPRMMLLGAGTGRRVLATVVFNAAVMTAVGGGVLAGGLHAVSGPDHLAALLPRIMGKSCFPAMRIGAMWGLGHGLSAMLLGMAAFSFKGRLGLDAPSIEALGSWTEGLIGISLVAIGLLGLKESLLDNRNTAALVAATVDADADASLSGSSSGGAASPAAAARGGGVGGGVAAAAGKPETGGGSGAMRRAAPRGSKRAVFLNGMLHGFSWDGAPSLAPALALSTWRSVALFLLAYCSGTMLAMSATTTVIGEGSVRVGKALDQPDIPRKLSVASSLVAVAIGAAWTVKALFF